MQKATYQNVSAEGPLILAADGYHTGRDMEKCAAQSHDGFGGEPAVRSPQVLFHLRTGACVTLDKGERLKDKMCFYVILFLLYCCSMTNSLCSPDRIADTVKVS